MKRVMVIDDSHTVRLFHKQVLEGLGIEVIEAQNGIEALEKSILELIDLFLVDVNMPKMDGYRFLAELRVIPDRMAIPAIMISTEAKAQDRTKAYEAGANLYLFKPVKPEILQKYVILMAGVSI